MDAVKTQQMMNLVAERMVASEPLLTKLDQAIGDGDHGIGMQRGFKAVNELLSGDYRASDVAALFKEIGTTMMSTMGGASGAIFGTLFRAGAKGIKGAETLDTAQLAVLLDAGLQGVYKRGGAQPGDKTMIDALAAAVEKAQALELPLVPALAQIASAAEAGAESTKQMIATTGKAKTLGERSLGHPDPGAVSMSLILRFMADFAAEQAEQAA